MRRAFRAVRLALAFLTVVRVPIRDGEVTPAGLAEARFAYPVAGLAIGLVLATLSEALRRAGATPGPSAFLLVAAGVALSGALHLDGLADSADGLFLWGDADRRLAVMRDPRVGSFGVVALALVLLGKFAALDAIHGPARSLAVLGAATIARALILIPAGMAPYARPEGTGRSVIDAANPRDALGAAMLASAVGLASAGLAGLMAASVAVVVVLVLTQSAWRKLGGVTGDILGASVELAELSFLLTLGLTGG